MMMMSTKSSVATAFHPMAIHGGRSSLPLRALPLPLPSLPGSGPRLRPGGAGRPRGWLTARPCAPVSCYHSSTADSTDQLQRGLRLGSRPLRARPWPPAFLRKLSRRHEPCSTRPARVRGKAADSECPVLTACKFESLTASPGRRDGFRLTPLRMCSCGRGLARACLLVLPWSVCLGRPAESRARPGRAHSAAETAIPVALVVDFRALQVASNGLGASARS